jgi:hypothetical protein
MTWGGEEKKTEEKRFQGMFGDDATLAELEAGAKPKAKPTPSGGRPRAPQQEERKVFSIDDELDEKPVSKKQLRKPQPKG